MDRLISKQKILEAIDNLKVNFTCYDSVTLDEVASHVKAIPSAEPKTGHWIWQTEDIYRCSECGEDIRVKEVMNVPQYKVCPMCEARMVEPQESEG